MGPHRRHSSGRAGRLSGTEDECEAAETEYRARNRHRELRNTFARLSRMPPSAPKRPPRRALKSAMRTLQGLANEQQLAISKLQESYGEHKILQDLLEIDHMNSQFGRVPSPSPCSVTAGSAGSGPSPPLYDVVRSAKGRIRHYTRVEIHVADNFAMVSRAVEPVALVLAELLDNATSYSRPTPRSRSTSGPCPRASASIIDDAGVGMNEEEKSRAARLLSGRAPGGCHRSGQPAAVRLRRHRRARRPLRIQRLRGLGVALRWRARRVLSATQEPA